MQMLEPGESLDEAAFSRFFSTSIFDEPPVFSETLPDAFSFSEGFLIRHSDLLHNGPTVILQAGLDSSMNPTELSEPHSEVGTLVFDPSQSTRALYRWRFTRTVREIGRITSYIGVAKVGVIAARRAHDEQGRAQTFQSEDPQAAWRIMERLATSSMLASQADLLRKKKDQAEQTWIKMSLFGSTKYGNKLYEKKVEALKAHVERIAFMPTI